MSAYILRLALFVTLVSVASLVGSSVKAGVVRTYQFVDDGHANLRFGGGLISGNSFARPRGTFDITIEEDGSATITRFDVNVANVIVETDGASLFTEGNSLGNYFFGVDPVGLNARFDSSVVFSSRPKALEPLDVLSRVSPFLDISLSSLADSQVSVFISASPGSFLDNPSLLTVGTGSSATLAAVPEPCGLTILASISLLLLCKRRAFSVARSASGNSSRGAR